MAGVSDLDQLISTLKPRLREGLFVFCNFRETPTVSAESLLPIATFMEDEGLTMVLPKDRADAADLEYQGVFRCLTLTVHSSLEAVGLTAAVATALAQEGISANVIAAYYHDHVFVPAHRADQARRVLDDLASR